MFNDSTWFSFMIRPCSDEAIRKDSGYVFITVLLRGLKTQMTTLGAKKVKLPLNMSFTQFFSLNIGTESINVILIEISSEKNTNNPQQDQMGILEGP